MLIPDAYVNNIQERLALYTELDGINNEEELIAFSERMVDRFGRMPAQVRELMEGLRLRWVAKNLGFERVSIKGGKLRCYFIANPQSAFYESAFFNNLLKTLQQLTLSFGISIKQSGNALMLIKEKVHTLSQSRDLLERIHDNQK